MLVETLQISDGVTYRLANTVTADQGHRRLLDELKAAQTAEHLFDRSHSFLDLFEGGHKHLVQTCQLFVIS